MNCIQSLRGMEISPNHLEILTWGLAWFLVFFFCLVIFLHWKTGNISLDMYFSNYLVFYATVFICHYLFMYSKKYGCHCGKNEGKRWDQTRAKRFLRFLRFIFFFLSESYTLNAYLKLMYRHSLESMVCSLSIKLLSR